MIGLDTYSRNARLKPGLIVSLPIALAVLAWFPDAKLGAVWALFVACGGTFLLAQMARDRGKAKEKDLFEKFGGHPTIRRLKQLDAPNAVTLQRYRKRIGELLPNVQLPTPNQERDDPSASQLVYESIMQSLIEKTRDQQKFDLLFNENCSYGFRRNLWAMKPIAFPIALTASTAVGVLVHRQQASRSLQAIPVVCAIALASLVSPVGHLVHLEMGADTF